MEALCLDNKLYYLQNELSMVKQLKGEEDIDNKKRKRYKKEIKNIIRSTQESLNKLNVQPIDVNNESTKLYENMDKLLFRKPWHRLPKFHKVVKIKEFVETNNLGKKEKKKLLERILLDMFENKTIESKHVKYDPEKECITSIKNVIVTVNETED
jgi:hypothetical protein